MLINIDIIRVTTTIDFMKATDKRALILDIEIGR